MNQKKVLLKIAKYIGLVFLLMVGYFIGVFLYTIKPKTFEPPLLSNDYYKAEQYVNTDPLINFSIFYYYEDLGEITNNDYKFVEDNTEKLKNYIDTTLNLLHKNNESINIEFNYDNITSNDSYYVKYFKDENLFVFHYFDEEEHILYKMLLSKDYIDR